MTDGPGPLIRNAWPLGAELGEGPIWVERDRALWFVDIKRQRIHRFETATGARRSWDAPEQIGFILPAERGGFVVGLQSGLHHFAEATGAFDPIVEVEPDLPGNRLNDGVIDPSGRLWFGTMADDERGATGAFYCFAEGRLTRTQLANITITNGPAVSPDGRLLYVVDTLKGTIGVADIRDDGTLGDPRTFVRIDPAVGHPDGPTVDAEGCLWISLFGGWRVQRYAPSGELLEQVRLPVPNITKVAFGGPDLRTVYATTARLHLSAEQLTHQPASGDLFEFTANVSGIATPLLRY